MAMHFATVLIIMFYAVSIFNIFIIYIHTKVAIPVLSRDFSECLMHDPFSDERNSLVQYFRLQREAEVLASDCH
uniref:Uncharacterized protein n=1 Tax=Ascaris lumbricoides TaxID=6252 RepID=A0A9J2QC46_ASCLU